jgi:hypothetical protein
MITVLNTPTPSQRFITLLVDVAKLVLARKGMPTTQKQLGLCFGIAPHRINEWLKGNNGINLNGAMKLIQNWNTQEGFPKISVIQVVLLEEQVIWDFTMEAR